MMHLTWKPPGAVSILSTVIVSDQMPKGQVTQAQYRGLLESRIAKMVDRATPDDLRLLRLATAEGVDLAGLAPDQVAESMMLDSEALAMALGLSEVTWPVEAMPINPEALDQIRMVDLGTFLTVLYPRQD